MNSLNKTKFIFATLIIIVAFIFLGLIFFAFFNQNNNEYVFKQKQIPTPSVIETPYSNLNRLIPGESVASDVDRLAGKPSSIKKVGEKTYLYYNTPVSGDKNSVLLINGVVFYAFEYVFGDYRGNYGDYVKKYGNPDITLYDNPYPWYVFLKGGVMIQSPNNFITKIVYFVPQNETDFYNKIAADFGLSRENLQNTQGESLPIPAP